MTIISKTHAGNTKRLITTYNNTKHGKCMHYLYQSMFLKQGTKYFPYFIQTIRQLATVLALALTVLESYLANT